MIQPENRKTDAKLYAKLTLNLRRLFRVPALTLNLARLFCVLFCVCFALLPLAGQAAEIYINSATSTNGEFGINQQWKAEVFLDTAGENINAVEGKLLFPSDLLEAKTISDGNSAISLWIEKPALESDGRITFAGITPGGFNIRQGLIFSVIFSSKQAGNGTLSFSGSRALLNDGQGTAASLTASGSNFIISSQLPAPALPTVKDIYPPEEFLPKITSAPGIFDGQWFLVFATQDKGSGMAGYAVYETKQKQKNTKDIKWLPAESPYLLSDQTLSGYIYVKAVDQAGNERIEIISPRHPAAGGLNILIPNTAALIIIIVALILIVTGYFILILWRKKGRRKKRKRPARR
jgi:hypothetical protein